MKPSYFPVLDGVRGYAVMMVMIAHFFQVDEASLYINSYFWASPVFKLSQIGLKGVELFFLLSGYLITNILICERGVKGALYMFYMRRVLRIFPLYYFVLFVSFAILPLIQEVDAHAASVITNQAWLWGYGSNISRYFGFNDWDSSVQFPWFGHFWSLAVEEHFYLIWPNLVLNIPEKMLPIVMWLLVFSSTFFVTIDAVFPGICSFCSWSTAKYSGVLALGGIVAYYRKDVHKSDLLYRLSSRLVIPLLVCFLLFSFLPRSYKFSNLLLFYSSVTFFASVLILCIGNNKVMRSIFVKDWSIFIGKISYGVYVYHGLVRPYFKEWIYKSICNHFESGIATTFAYVVLSSCFVLIISYVSWILFERFFVRLKDLFHVKNSDSLP